MTTPFTPSKAQDSNSQVVDCKFFAGGGGSIAVPGATFYNGWWRDTTPKRPPSFYGGRD